MQLTIEVAFSAFLVIVVIWAMWGLPWTEGAYYNWGPPLALWSVWVGLAAVIVSILPWLSWLPIRWGPMVFLMLDPVSLTAGLLTLWVYRGEKNPEQTIALQRTQAKLGVALGLVAVVIGYGFVLTHRGG